MIDLSALVGSFSTGPLAVSRRGAGAFVDGIYVPASASSVVVDAVVTPVTGRQLRALPEGQRTREPIAIYSVEALRTAAEPAGVAADVVTWQGSTYEVQTVEDWTANGNFYVSIAVKVTAS